MDASNAPLEMSDSVLFTREPVFHRNGSVYGYELHHWQDTSQPTINPVEASRVIVNTVLGAGLTPLTRGTRAFFDTPEALLVSGACEVLSPDDVILDLSPDVGTSEEVHATCRSLAHQGFRLALDGLVSDDVRFDLLPYAAMIKIDMRSMTPEDAVALKEKILGEISPGVDLVFGATQLVAEEHRLHLEAAGFQLFQGPLFAQPEPVATRQLSHHQLTILDLLNRVHQVESVSTDDLVATIQRDPPLTFRILQLANSAFIGSRRIASVAHAINVLGREYLARWLALLLAASQRTLSGRQQELLREALVRAAHCEMLARDAATAPPPATLFLVGLFSNIGAVLGCDTETILERVNLVRPIEDAILRGTGPFAPILAIVKGYNPEEWSSVSPDIAALGLTQRRVTERWLEAVAWAAEQEAPLLDH